MTVYVFYMLALGIYNFRVRVRAVRSKTLSIGYFKAYDGDVSQDVIVAGRHFDNQFQLPLLFLITCLAYLTMKNTEQLTIIFAWIFVVTRFGHSYEHLGKNNINRRVLWYVLGWFSIVFLWGRFYFIS